MNGIPGVRRRQSDSKVRPVGGYGLFSRRCRSLFCPPAGVRAIIVAKDDLPSGIEPEYGPDHHRNRPDLSLPNYGPARRSGAAHHPGLDRQAAARGTVPGVADVLSFGGDVKQYQVIVDQQALVNYNIPLKSLFDAIQNNNQNTGANFIEHGDQQYVVAGLGLVKDIQDIKNIVLIRATEHP